MSETPKPIAFHQRFAAAFDAPCLSKRARVILLITGAAFAWYWLPHLAYLFLWPVIDGHALPQARWLLWLLKPLGMVNAAIFAFAVGVIGAGATRRFRWMVGPILIIVVAVLATVGSLYFTRHGLPITDYHGKTSLMHYQWGHNGLVLIPFAVMLFFSGLGGCLSPGIFRRVRPSIVAGSAGAWVLAGAVGTLLQYGFFGYLTGKGLTSGIIPNYQVFLKQSLPFFLGGLWLGWALRGYRLWIPAVGLGLMKLYYAVLIGFIGKMDVWGVINHYESQLFLPLSSALIGAWLGVLIAGARSRRELLWPGLVVVGLIVLHIIVNQLILRLAF